LATLKLVAARSGAIFAGALTFIACSVLAATLSPAEARLLSLRELPEDGLRPGALGPQERYGVYRIIGMKAHLATYGSFDPGDDVMDSSRIKLSSS
jgi:hypothetical protein